MYEQAPQLYSQMLQNGLDKQFQLATQAQPVSQFLAGLRQAQAIKAQQEAMARQAAQDQWQRQKFEDQMTYNRGRDTMVDTRTRELDANDLKEKAALRAERELNDLRQRQAKGIDQFNAGENADPEQTAAMLRASGNDPKFFGSQQTIQTQEGPVTDEHPLPTKVEMKFNPGQGWTAMVQAKTYKQNEILRAERQRQDDKQENLRLAASLRPAGNGSALGMGKIPPGYRMTPDGNMEAIPGGPGANKESATQSKASAALEGVNNEMDRLYQSAEEAKNHPGLPSIIGWTRLGRIAPGQDAADARALIGSLKAKGGFAVLQAMRASSPTGGALGQVSDKEEQLLQNAIASLDDTQGLPQMQASLDKFKQYTQDAKARIRNAYEMQFGGGQSTDVHPEAKPKVGNPFSAITKGGKQMAVGTTRTSKRTKITETWNGQAWEQ